MKICSTCGKDISDRGRSARWCIGCATQREKKQDKERHRLKNKYYGKLGTTDFSPTKKEDELEEFISIRREMHKLYNKKEALDMKALIELFKTSKASD